MQRRPTEKLEKTITAMNKQVTAVHNEAQSQPFSSESPDAAQRKKVLSAKTSLEQKNPQLTA